MAETEKATNTEQVPGDAKAPATGTSNAGNTSTTGNTPDIFTYIDLFLEMGNPRLWPKSPPELCEKYGLDAENKYLYYHKNVGFGVYVDDNPSTIARYCRFNGSYEIHNTPNITDFGFYDEVANAFNTLYYAIALKNPQNPQIPLDNPFEPHSADDVIKSFNDIGITVDYVTDIFNKYNKNTVMPVLMGNNLSDCKECKGVIYKLVNENIDGGSRSLTDYLKKIMDQCPNHNHIIEDDYYDELINFVKYCEISGTDEKTKKQIQCKDVIREGYFSIPYSQWKPEVCKNDCVKLFDSILRERYKGKSSKYCEKSMFYTGCEVFTSSDGNPFENCGKNYDPSTDNVFGEKVVSIEDNTEKETTNGVTTITCQIPLLTLIMFIIFVFLK